MIKTIKPIIKYLTVGTTVSIAMAVTFIIVGGITQIAGLTGTEPITTIGQIVTKIGGGVVGILSLVVGLIATGFASEIAVKNNIIGKTIGAE